MVRFIFDKPLTGEEIRDIIQKELGSTFRVSIKKNRVEIIQDTTKACIFTFKRKESGTECSGPSGFMPLGLPRTATIIGSTALLTVVFYQSKNYLILGMGALILALLMRLPAQSLVEKVTGILKSVARRFKKQNTELVCS